MLWRRAAHEAGAQVTTWWRARSALATPHGVAASMFALRLADARSRVMAQTGHADVFIATAAVADWRPAQVAKEKIKKRARRQHAKL